MRSPQWFFFFKIAMFKDFLNSRRKKKQGDYGSHQLREVQCCNHILLLFPLFPPLTGFKLWSYNDTLLGIWNFKGTDCLSTNKQLFKTAWILWSFKHKLWGLILVTLKANLGWVSHSLSPRASRSVRILMRFIIAAFPAFFSFHFHGMPFSIPSLLVCMCYHIWSKFLVGSLYPGLVSDPVSHSVFAWSI